MPYYCPPFFLRKGTFMWPCLCLEGLVTTESSEEPGDAIVTLSRHGEINFSMVINRSCWIERQLVTDLLKLALFHRGAQIPTVLLPVRSGTITSTNPRWKWHWAWICYYNSYRTDKACQLLRICFPSKNQHKIRIINNRYKSVTQFSSDIIVCINLQRQTCPITLCPSDLPKRLPSESFTGKYISSFKRVKDAYMPVFSDIGLKKACF